MFERIQIRKKETTGSIYIPLDAYLGEPFVNLYDGILMFSGASGGGYTPAVGQPGVFEVGSNLSSQYISGNLSANTFFSAGTNLYDIFLTSAPASDITRVQPGLNTYTGGTDNSPSVNISAATLNYLSATTISADTIYTHTISGMSPVNINGIIAENGTLSVTSISASTIISGSTDLYNIFATPQTTIYNLKEIDTFMTSEAALDFAINSGATKAAISFTDGTVKIINLTTMKLITSLSVASCGYIRYCPASDEFWVLKTDGLLITRIDDNNIITGTTAVPCLYYPFDVDDTYVYLAYNSGADYGVYKILQTDITSTGATVIAGNGNRYIKTFQQNSVWYLAIMSTYACIIYDTSYNIMCTPSALMGVYNQYYLTTSSDGHYLALMTNYNSDPTYSFFSIVDISDFNNLSLVFQMDKTYKGEVFLDTDKFLWNTKNSVLSYFDNRIIVSDYNLTEFISYQGVYKNSTTTSPQSFKYNNIYYFLFGSDVGSSLRTYQYA